MCDSCGMEYDTVRAKAKIREIRGTVKVEGNSIQAEGAASADSLVKRASILREDGEIDTAVGVYNEVLAIEPESADGNGFAFFAKKERQEGGTLRTVSR